jgi:hypothetical protein
LFQAFALPVVKGLPDVGLALSGHPANSSKVSRARRHPLLHDDGPVTGAFGPLDQQRDLGQDTVPAAVFGGAGRLGLAQHQRQQELGPVPDLRHYASMGGANDAEGTDGWPQKPIQRTHPLPFGPHRPPARCAAHRPGLVLPRAEDEARRSPGKSSGHRSDRRGRRHRSRDRRLGPGGERECQRPKLTHSACLYRPSPPP